MHLRKLNSNDQIQFLLAIQHFISVVKYVECVNLPPGKVQLVAVFLSVAVRPPLVFSMQRIQVSTLVGRWQHWSLLNRAKAIRTTGLSLTPFSSTSEGDEVSSGLSWDERTKQFLKDSSNPTVTSQQFLPQAQAVIEQLVPMADDGNTEEVNAFSIRKTPLLNQKNEPKNVALAFDFLDRMLELEHEAIAGAGDYEMVHHGLNNRCLNAVLKLWRESKNSNKSRTLSAEEVLERLDHYRSVRSSSLWIPDVQSYNILLDGAGLRGEIDFCDRVYRWMWTESEQDSLLRPDNVTLRTMFKAYIHAMHNQGTNVDAPEACEALAEDWMKRTQSTSSQVIYQSLIHAWALSDPVQSEVYLKAMAQRCLEGEEEGPDTVAWNRVISAYAIRHDQPQKAAELLEEFWQYSQLLEEAAETEDELKSRTVARPDLFSYNSVLEGWARANNSKEANKTFTRLQTASSTAPNAISFTSAIKANRSNWERVEELANDCIQAYQVQEQSMDEECSQEIVGLDLPFFHAWLQAALHAGGGAVAVTRARSILDRMRSLKIQPDTKSYLILLDCFLQNNDDIEGATKWFMENAKSDMDEASIATFVSTILTMVDDISIVPPLLQFPRRQSISLLQAICDQNFLTRPETVERLISQLNAGQGQAILQFMKYECSTKAFSIVLRNMANESNGPGAETVFRQWKEHHSDDDLSSLADMYTSLIMAWSKNGNVARCEYWLQEWLDDRQLLRQPDKRVQTAIMSAFAKAGDAEGAQNVLIRFRDQGGDPDVVMHNVVLNTIAKSGSSQLAEEYLKQEMKGVRDIFSYNTIINARVQEDDVESALKWVEQVVDLFQKENNLSCQPDLVTFRPVLSWLRRSRDVHAAERAEEVLRWMNDLYEQGALTEAPDSHCYQLVLDAWSKSRAPNSSKRTEDFLRYMMDDATSLSYATVMRSYKRNPARKLALLDEMYGAYLQGNNSLKPSVEIFRLVFEDLARTSPERAESFVCHRMAKMYSDGLNTAKPTRKAYNLVLKSWAQKQDDPKAHIRAESLLRELQSKYLEDGDPSLMPTMESYKAVLTITSKQKQVSKVESLFDELFGAYCASPTNALKDSLKPDLACIHAVLLAYRSTNDAAKAQKFLSQLEEWKDTNVLDTELSVQSYNMVLSSMAGQGLAEDCEFFLLQHMMKDRGIEPDIASFNTVMTAWSRSRLPEAGARAQSLLSEKMTVAPDALTFSIFLRTVVKSNGPSPERKKQQAESVLEQMKAHGVEPTARDRKLLSVAKVL